MVWAEKVLSKREVLFFFAGTSLFYIFPFIHADYAYVDDAWRSLLLGDDGWRTHGRVLLEWVVKFFAFNNATINVFPLPLLIATFLISLAMSRLTFWYFPTPNLASCLVVMPMLCNPFFLGNITYQYDGPGMMLTVVAAIYAVTLEKGSILFRGFSTALLIVFILGVYQLSITIFIGLCCVEFLWGLRNKRPVQEVMSDALQRGLQLAVGGFLYYVTIFQMAVNQRMNFSSFNQFWFERIIEKLAFSLRRILELVNAGNLYFVFPLIVFACVGFALIMRDLRVSNGEPWGKIAAFIVCLCAVCVMVAGVPGAMLFAAEPNLEARNYLGFSVVLLFIFLLNYEVSVRFWPALRMFLVVPVLCMFSLCYAYGQIIVAKKELETALATFISYDVVSAPELRSVSVFYFLGAGNGGVWLPRGHGAMIYMPVLKYILSDSSTLLRPHFLTRLGVNNVLDGPREMFKIVAVGDKTFRPVLDRKFYSIYASEAGGFIAMKNMDDADVYIERP